MAEIVTVFNDAPETYTEEFRGKKYIIPAKGSIDMPRREAVMLKGNYVPVEKDGNGQSLTRKSLRWETKIEAPPEQVFVCHFIDSSLLS